MKINRTVGNIACVGVIVASSVGVGIAVTRYYKKKFAITKEYIATAEMIRNNAIHAGADPVIISDINSIYTRMQTLYDSIITDFDTTCNSIVRDNKSFRLIECLIDKLLEVAGEYYDPCICEDSETNSDSEVVEATTETEKTVEVVNNETSSQQ
jgi:hypothetical protein